MNALGTQNGSPGAVVPPPFAWISEILAFLRCKTRLILACAAPVVLLASLYLALAKPHFTASTTLMIDTRQAAFFRQRPAMSDAQIENAYIESEVEVLRSPGLARKAVARLGLANDPQFPGPPPLLARIFGALHRSASEDKAARDDRLVQAFLSMVSARRIGLTYVIEIDATAADPRLAARLANGLVESYLADQITQQSTASRGAADWLRKRLADLRQQALKADEAVQAFKAQAHLVDTGHGMLNDEQVSQLNVQLTLAQGRVADAQARLDRIRADAAQPGAASDTLASPVINQLRERYLLDAQRAADFTARYGSKHIATVNMRREMAELQNSINNEIRRINETAQNDLTNARAVVADLQAQLDWLVSRSDKENASRATLRSLQSAADAYRSVYAAFLQRVDQSTEDENSPVVDARVITAARPPLTKSAPKGKLVLVAAVVLGLGLGFLAALLRETLGLSPLTAADLQSRTGLRCLAVLPNRIPGGRRVSTSATGSAAHAQGDRPLDNAMQQLAFRLGIGRRTGRGRLIGFVGADPGAGAPTVAAALVAHLVAAGRSAALLDLSAPSPGLDAAGREGITVVRGEHEVVVVSLPALTLAAAHATLEEVNALVLVIDAGRWSASALSSQLQNADLENRMLAGVVVNERAPASPCQEGRRFPPSAVLHWVTR